MEVIDGGKHRPPEHGKGGKSVREMGDGTESGTVRVSRGLKGDMTKASGNSEIHSRDQIKSTQGRRRNGDKL